MGVHGAGGKAVVTLCADRASQWWTLRLDGEGVSWGRRTFATVLLETFWAREERVRWWWPGVLSGRVGGGVGATFRQGRGASERGSECSRLRVVSRWSWLVLERRAMCDLCLKFEGRGDATWRRVGILLVSGCPTVAPQGSFGGHFLRVVDTSPAGMGCRGVVSGESCCAHVIKPWHFRRRSFLMIYRHFVWPHIWI